MANVFSIFIPCTPKAVQSVRSFVAGKKIMHYQPKDVVDWKTYIQVSILNALTPAWTPLECPVSIDVVYIFSPRKSEKKTILAEIADGAWYYKTTRPDMDNLGKGLYDACTGVLWKDDSQIAEKHEVKVYGKKEGIMICVNKLPTSIQSSTSIS